MNLEDRKEIAAQAFVSGLNCAQSVAVAFEDVTGAERRKLEALALPFGGGFGRTRNLCGAVSAIGLVYGLSRPETFDPAGASAKTEAYKIISETDAEFKERNGSDNCGELLKNIKSVTGGYTPQARDQIYYNTRPCLKFVLDAVEIIYGKLLCEHA